MASEFSGFGEASQRWLAQLKPKSVRRRVRSSVSLYVEPNARAAFAADALVSTCIESGSRGLLLDEPVTPPEFFDLSTRLAGELLHGLSKYSLRVAVVVPDLSIHSPSFQDFVHESNRGSLARFFESRREAVEWLESYAQA